MFKKFFQMIVGKKEKSMKNAGKWKLKRNFLF